MQAVLHLLLSPTFIFSYSPSDYNEFAEESRKKLKMENENLRNEKVMEQKQVGNADDDDKTNEEEVEEFSFVCSNQYASPIFAEYIFHNGQICPMFPIFDPNLALANGYGGSPHGSYSPDPPSLKKLSIQRPEISSLSTSSLDRTSECSEPERSMNAMVETSLERCKKSNSDGFSKLWRFKNTFGRSKSNGKDALVTLNLSPSSSGKETENVEGTKSGARDNAVVEKVKVPKGGKRKTAPSAHEKYYVKNRAKKENDKRRSYLPYKIDFFTSAIGIRRKVLPSKL